jgi:hypothetical protein
MDAKGKTGPELKRVTAERTARVGVLTSPAPYSASQLIATRPAHSNCPASHMHKLSCVLSVSA